MNGSLSFDGGVTAVATVIATLIASGIAYLVSLWTLRRTELDSLNQQLLQLNMIALQYPCLEDARFIADWAAHRDSADENFLRYSNYACIVFNFLESVARHFNYERQKIEDYIHFAEMAQTHRAWWDHPAEEVANIQGYPVKFRNLVRGYLS